MRSAIRIASVVLSLGLCATETSTAADAALGRAVRLLHDPDTILIDGHNDLPWAIRAYEKSPGDVAAYDLRVRTAGHTDLPRLRQGGVGAQFWSVFIPSGAEGGYARTQLEQIDTAKRMIARYPEALQFARSADEIVAARRAGRIASLLGMEGGHAIENSLGALRAFYDLGVRYMTLTHSAHNDWADSATQAPPRHHGLSTFGEEVVKEMNRLGMLVDLSHVSTETMDDALRVSLAPVIFSHSSARALCDVSRNVPDDILRRVKLNGGVVMVTFVANFIDPEAERLFNQTMVEIRKAIAGKGPEETARIADEIMGRLRSPGTTVSMVADHIEHVRRIAGVEHVGIGGDFDGATLFPDELADVSMYPTLFAELIRRGWSDHELRMLAGGNLLRVLRRAEATAAELQLATAPSLATYTAPAASAQATDPQDGAEVRQAMRHIRADSIRAHTRFLSDGALEGRAPGTRGYDIAARYVQTQMEAIGLQPAGTGGTWYQRLALRESVVDRAKSSLTLIAAGKEERLAAGRDYLLSADLLRNESAAEAPVVFVGFGVSAPNRQYDDYAGLDVNGKIVAAIHGAPAAFPATERAYYSDGLLKQKNAIARGAIGMLSIVLPEDRSRFSWDSPAPQTLQGVTTWLDAAGVPHNAHAQLQARALLNDEAARKLFASTASFDRAARRARNSKPQGFGLPVSVRMNATSTHKLIDSVNVVGKLEGSDPVLRNEYVVYTTHLDHLGVCPPVDGDSVCHGTIDNASGAATLLDVARAYSSLSKPPRRSVLFVFVTAEETGLLGSDYFATHPPVPRQAIVANVNIDGAPGIYFAMKDVVPMGAEHSTLGAAVESAAREVGYEISADPMPEEVIFVRSDQYSFVRQGVPALYIADGVKPIDPHVDGLGVIKQWLALRYHTPADNMEQPLDFESAAKGARLNFLVGYEVAQRESRPEWKQGDFFGTMFGKASQ